MRSRGKRFEISRSGVAWSVFQPHQRSGPTPKKCHVRHFVWSTVKRGDQTSVGTCRPKTRADTCLMMSGEPRARVAFGPQGLRRYARASLLCVARVSAGAPADMGGAPAGGAAAAGGGMGAVAPGIGRDWRCRCSSGRKPWTWEGMVRSVLCSTGSPRSFERR